MQTCSIYLLLTNILNNKIVVFTKIWVAELIRALKKVGGVHSGICF